VVKLSSTRKNHLLVPRSDHGCLDGELIAVREKERMGDDELKQLVRFHTMDAAYDVFLIAHAEMLDGVAQIEKMAWMRP
jgi:hypothetical protein